MPVVRSQEQQRGLSRSPCQYTIVGDRKTTASDRALWFRCDALRHQFQLPSQFPRLQIEFLRVKNIVTDKEEAPAMKSCIAPGRVILQQEYRVNCFAVTQRGKVDLRL